MTEQLKPCPFCGGVAESDKQQPFRHCKTGEQLAQVAVFCTSCSAEIAHFPGDLSLDRWDTSELVIAAWNTRATEPRDAEIERLRYAVAQYRDDLMHPPLPDSKLRRLEMIETLLKGAVYD